MSVNQENVTAKATNGDSNGAVVTSPNGKPVDEGLGGPKLEIIPSGYTSSLEIIKAMIPKDIHTTTRSGALALIKGQQATIPNLLKVRPEWVSKLHADAEQLRKEMDEWLTTMAKSPEELAGLIGSDIGGFAAWWSPEAEYKNVRWVSYYLGWLFLWDDKFEAALSTDVDDARNQQKDALEYIPKTLLSDSADIPEHTNPLLQVWKTLVADPIRETYDYDHRALIVSEIKDYFFGLERESTVISKETLPTLEEYWEYRAGAISLRFLIVANELTANVRLPLVVLNNPEMINIWNAALEHIWLVNDILSGYKEVQVGDVSLLALLVARFGDLQSAVNAASAGVLHAALEFDNAAVRLKRKFQHDHKVVEDLDVYLKACRQSCVGNIEWSLATPRYKLAQFTDNEGKLVVKM